MSTARKTDNFTPFCKTMRMNGKGNFENKVYLIFGASSGIGLAVAERLSERGATVYSAARHECFAEGVKNVLTDVSEDGAVEAAVAKVLADCGRLDGLIYSSGFSICAPVACTTERDTDYILRVNLEGAIRAVKSAVPAMSKEGGRIVFISSMGGVVPILYDPLYSATKAALVLFAKELYVELAPAGIKTTAMLVGGTRTLFTVRRAYYAPDSCAGQAKRVAAAYDALAKIEQNGMKPGRVADIIVKTLEKKNPNATVATGLVNKLLHSAARIMPEKLTLFLVKIIYSPRRA